MLINLYDINLNYVKMIPIEEIANKENRELYHKHVAIRVIDNNNKEVLKCALFTDRSELYVEVVKKFLNEYNIIDLLDSQIHFKDMKTVSHTSDFPWNTFLYSVEVKLNKNQVKQILGGK